MYYSYVQKSVAGKSTIMLLRKILLASIKTTDSPPDTSCVIRTFNMLLADVLL